MKSFLKIYFSLLFIAVVGVVVIQRKNQEIRGTIVIGIIGDSMLQTAGQDFPYLTKYLKELFPNLGVNSTNYSLCSR